jgi:hypothetical protein
MTTANSKRQPYILFSIFALGWRSGFSCDSHKDKDWL